MPCQLNPTWAVCTPAEMKVKLLFISVWKGNLWFSITDLIWVISCIYHLEVTNRVVI